MSCACSPFCCPTTRPQTRLLPRTQRTTKPLQRIPRRRHRHRICYCPLQFKTCYLKLRMLCAPVNRRVTAPAFATILSAHAIPVIDKLHRSVFPCISETVPLAVGVSAKRKQSAFGLVKFICTELFMEKSLWLLIQIHRIKPQTSSGLNVRLLSTGAGQLSRRAIFPVF